jgi:hypothetical protein
LGLVHQEVTGDDEFSGPEVPDQIEDELTASSENAPEPSVGDEPAQEEEVEHKALHD